MNGTTTIQALAASIVALENSEQTEWRDRWSERINELIAQLPSGSGIDCGTELIDYNIKSGELVSIRLKANFHHMDDSGLCDGWTSHTITVKPCWWHGVRMSVSGRDRNQIKDYLAELYYQALSEPAPSLATD